MAVALQQAVQVGPAAFIFSVRPAVFVLALLQEGDHVMVTEVRRLVHRRAPPPGDERKDSLNGEQKSITWQNPIGRILHVRWGEGQKYLDVREQNI